MENKPFTLVLVVTVGVLLGAGIVIKQTNDPLLRKIIEQQEKIIKSQSNVEAKLSPSSATETIANLLAKQQAMEQKMVALESQLKMMQAQKPSAPAPQQPPSEDYGKVYNMEVSHSPVYGKKDAPVTIVEFVDFQCPFCARFHPPMIAAVQAYPDKVNYMIKNFPLSFHPQARPAAKAAFAAGEQGKYFEMVDAILTDNRSLGEDKFKELAKKIGLNVDKFMKDYKDKDAQWEDYIGKDLQLGEKSDVGGTPTFFINGKKTMARDTEGYKKEIDALLAK